MFVIMFLRRKRMSVFFGSKIRHHKNLFNQLNTKAPGNTLTVAGGRLLRSEGPYLKWIDFSGLLI